MKESENSNIKERCWLLSGNISFYPVSGELRDGDQILGQTTILQARALEYLYNHSDSTVSHFQLYQGIYPDEHFESMMADHYSRLATVVGRLRKRLSIVEPLLGEHIVSVHGRGYRWSRHLQKTEVDYK